MVKRSFLLLFIFMMVLPAGAQPLIDATVTDSSNKPLAFVSIVLLKNGRFEAGTSSDSDGRFQLKHPAKAGADFVLKLSLAGFFSTEYLFATGDTVPVVFKLTATKQLLDEITLTAKRPLISRRSDRYIINVENSFLAEGNSGLEVLQKSPGISVNSDGSIRLKGNQPVTVMINDVVQRMGADELAEYLKSLKSEDISKIEVIQNPPAEFEASGPGGIVHIILKKVRRDGWNGSINTFQRLQGKRLYASGGTSVDLKIKDFYVSGGLSLSRDRNDSKAFTNITYANAALYGTQGTRANDNRRQQLRFGIGYDFNTRHSVTLQTVRTSNQFLNAFYTDSYYKDVVEETTGSGYTDWVRKPWFVATTFNYSFKIDTLGSGVKIIGDHTYGKKTELNQFMARYSDPQQDNTNRVSTPILTRMSAIQADYTKVWNDRLQLKTGIKYVSAYKDNKLIRDDLFGNSWKNDSLLSNHFLYDEDIVMIHFAAEKNFGKTIIKPGIRFEQTFSKGTSRTTAEQFSRKYDGWFPSLFITHTLNKKNDAVYVNYSRRLERPMLRQLNPYRLQFDSHTSMTGNPYLTPQYSHNMEAGYNFLLNFSASFYYTITDKVIGQIANLQPGNIIEYKYENLDKNMEYGGSVSAPLTLRSWSSVNNFSFYRSEYRFNEMRLAQTTWSFKSIHSVAIKNIVDIDVIAEYRSAYAAANIIMGAVFYCDLGLGRKIFNGKGRLKLYCSDITNSIRERETTDNVRTQIYFYQKRQTRNLSVSLNYNFRSGKKFSAKKVEVVESRGN